MANFNLTGQKIKNTYEQLAQVNDSNELVDGLGNSKQIVTSSIVNFDTEVSRSAAEAGFGAGSGGGVSEAVFTAYTSSNDSAVSVLDTRVDSLTSATSSYLTSLPSGVVSSSAQVDLAQAFGTAANATSALTANLAVTASYALNAGGDTEWDSILNKPSGLVSGSSQLPQIGINQTNITSLTSATSSYLTSLPSGVVSGSSQIDLSQATGTAANATSASYAVTASHVPGLAGAGLESGNSGTDSIKSAASLTTTAASVNGPQSIGIGNAAIVSGTGSLHISLDDSNTNSTGDQTINIGKDINNPNGYSTAIGHNLTNTGTGGNVLIGRAVTTAGDYSIGIGENAQAQQAGAVAIGQGTISSGNSVAIGQGSVMGSSYGFAGGFNARAQNDASVAIGGDVQVASNQAIAIGTDTNIDTNSQGAVALGQGIDVNTATNGIAIGKGVTINNTDEINIGDQIRYKNDGTGSVSFASAVRVDTTTLSGAGSTVSVDGTATNYFYLNNGGSTTTVSNPTNLQDGSTYTFKIDDGRNLTWGAAYKWPNGVVPTFSSGSDIISFVSIGGTNLYGTAQYNYQ